MHSGSTFHSKDDRRKIYEASAGFLEQLLAVLGQLREDTDVDYDGHSCDDRTRGPSIH